ncbi:MAG: LysM peptidoglycan-binding domain-containing protein [Candidatus Nanopelagicales bacterium]
MMATSPMPTTRTVLTKRGKFVLRAGIFVLAFLALVGYVVFSPSVDAVSDDFAPKTAIVVIQEGQTLWSLATDSQPERDPRDVVSDIYALNNLESGSQVYVGQVLHIPVSN